MEERRRKLKSRGLTFHSLHFFSFPVHQSNFISKKRKRKNEGEEKEGREREKRRKKEREKEKVLFFKLLPLPFTLRQFLSRSELFSLFDSSIQSIME